ncbi:MAG: hypothetical protein QOH63_1243 [Acidobacteriota bacterium]|nr:hypothetical protein [Acidobacteriota bacterium]
MDEQAIKRAAEDAVLNLQLDCEIKSVGRSPNGDEWCVQFSGKYGQFCDDFKNQFEKENSPRVVQEKIKSHLLKQVTKIRSSTGKSRRPRTNPSDEGQAQSSQMSAPFKMIEDAFSRASEIAGAVVQQVVGVAETARETVGNIAESVSPVTIEIRSDSNVIAKEPRSSSTRKPTRAAKARSAKTTKKAQSVSRKIGKQARKAGKLAAKVSGKVKKASAKKAARKTRRSKSKAGDKRLR